MSKRLDRAPRIPTSIRGQVNAAYREIEGTPGQIEREIRQEFKWHEGGDHSDFPGRRAKPRTTSLGRKVLGAELSDAGLSEGIVVDFQEVPAEPWSLDIDVENGLRGVRAPIETVNGFADLTPDFAVTLGDIGVR